MAHVCTDREHEVGDQAHPCGDAERRPHQTRNEAKDSGPQDSGQQGEPFGWNAHPLVALDHSGRTAQLLYDREQQQSPEYEAYGNGCGKHWTVHKSQRFTVT